MTTLNLGCGLDYHPGAINADQHDLTAADLQADVLRLPLADDSVMRIDALQLVEHLGYAGTVYALAEWRRVLKPGGTLFVETPDRPAACLAAARPDPPASVLHWLFGLPWAGYEHRTLFEDRDLHLLAQQAGFGRTATSRDDAPQPTLRLTACARDDPLAELRARLHIAFVSAGIVQPLTAPPHLELLETVIDRIVAAVEGLPQEGPAACMATVLGATARYDPRVTRVAVQVLSSRGVVSEAESAPVLKLAQELADEAFPARLAAWLRRRPSPPGTQAVRLRRLADEVSLYLTARLHPTEVTLQPVRGWMASTESHLAPSDREITFFCPDAIADLSKRETARGIRAFARDELSSARQHLKTAIAYNVDDPLPVWNLARLTLRKGHRLEALEQYAMLLELQPGAATALRSEMDAVTERKPDGWARFAQPVEWPRPGRSGSWMPRQQDERA
jgi:hypothetical protein